jgi:replicative superfamily II helicase
MQQNAVNLVSICRHICLSEDRNLVIFVYSRAEVTDLSFKLKVAIPELAECIDYHHAGRPLQEKVDVETRFHTRQLKILCSTRTLAAGVNLPAAVVIITASLFKQIKSDEEYWQIAGRCGRLGYDSNGLCITMCPGSGSQTDISNLKRWQRFQTPLFKGVLTSAITSKVTTTATFILWGLRCGLFKTENELYSLLERMFSLTPAARDTLTKALEDVYRRKLCLTDGDVIHLQNEGAAVSASSCCGGYEKALTLLNEVKSFRENPIILGSSFSDASTTWPKRHGSCCQHHYEPRHILAPQV